MKLLLLKILLQRRARDEGFTLPMVISLGLVMILLGTVNIVKSGEENLAAINTNSSSDALAIAEVGVARYRQLLNQNRILAVYNHQQWTSNSVSISPAASITRTVNVAGQTCDNISNTPTGWFDDDDASTDVAPNNTNQWWEVKQNLADDSIGEYKLVSYVYDHDNNDGDNDNGQFAPDDDNENDTDFFDYNNTASGYNPRGILTVQGRSADGSEAQIQVEIPLRINNLEELAPILWVGSGGAIATPGDLDITNSADNKIVLSDPGNECSKPADISGNDVLSDARTIPSIETIRDTIATASTATQTNKSYGSGEYFGKATGLNKYTTGIAGDECEAANDLCYLYELTDLTIEENASVDGAANVTVYVDGPVVIGDNNPLIITNITVGADSSSSSDYFELYVDNGNAITINTGLANTVNIKGLIHAPTSTLTINGNGNVNIEGAVWVGELVNNISGLLSGTVTITGDASSTGVGASQPAYKVYTTSETRTPRPITGNPTNWVKEEVD